jgi:hypothetical protein
MPVEPDLELAAVVGADLLDTEWECVDDATDEIVGGGLPMVIVSLGRAYTDCIIASHIPHNAFVPEVVYLRRILRTYSSTSGGV